MCHSKSYKSLCFCGVTHSTLMNFLFSRTKSYLWGQSRWLSSYSSHGRRKLTQVNGPLTSDFSSPQCCVCMCTCAHKKVNGRSSLTFLYRTLSCFRMNSWLTLIILLSISSQPIYRVQVT